MLLVYGDVFRTFQESSRSDLGEGLGQDLGHEVQLHLGYPMHYDDEEEAVGGGQDQHHQGGEQVDDQTYQGGRKSQS